MSCETCKNAIAEEHQEPVPFWAHQQSEARAAHREKRLFSIIILLIVLLVGCFFGWMYDRSQFETVTTTTYESDASDGGIAVANGYGSGNVNGKS